MAKHEDDARTGALAVPRSRGAVTGILLVALGAWGALLPLIGPTFHFGFGPDNSTFNFTEARVWLQFLPGVVTFAAGLFLLVGANKVTGIFFAYLACAAGAWFVVGPILADLRSSGYVGLPLGGSDRQHLDAIAAFYGLGAVILFLAAQTAGRLSVKSVRDGHRVETGDEAVYPTSAADPSAAPETITLPDAASADVHAEQRTG